MDFEIEFMPVGEGSKPGDCIIIRYGSPNQFEVMVVDGGTIDSGKAVVERLRFLCGRNVVISHMVCSHPDADHSSGLREVLDNLKVVNLWLHVPWSHAADTRHYFKDVRWTDEGLARKIREEYDITDELVRLAIKQGSKILEPFQGADIGPFTVLSPSRYAYTRLLPQFDRTPDPDQDCLESEGWWLGKQTVLARLIEAAVQKAFQKVQEWVEERWNKELLRDGGITSATNETSTVLFSNFGGRGPVLLTADAGVNALTWSINYAKQCGIALQNPLVIQVPHHGSRRNVGPTVLNALIGPPVGEPQEGGPSAVVPLRVRTIPILGRWW